MIRLTKYRKLISLFCAILFTVQMCLPFPAFALTSGPEQPEMKGFEPIGTSDMVDLFTGDFTYNIPLLDVGGYPVNLVYHSGANVDEEASWVGYGWTVSPGSLNRQLRGLPDDFNGTDELARTVNLKDHVTKGGSIQASLELLGLPVPKIKLKKKKKSFSLNTTISLGVKFDNYRGVGVDIGLNTGLNLTEVAAGHLTTSESAGNQQAALDTVTSSGVGPNLSLNLSSFDGASLSASQNFSIIRKQKDQQDKNAGISVGLGYNSRQGLSGMTLNTSFSKSKAKMEIDKTEKFVKAYAKGGSQTITQSFISFNGETYTPSIENATKYSSFSFSFSVGPEVFVAYVGLGGTGFYSKQSVSRAERKLPAYGFLNSHKAQNRDEDAIMDFNREKDIPYSKTVNNLPIPVPTYDLFLATSQDGGGQYRAYQGSAGVFFDPRTKNESLNASLGVELGAGTFIDVGVDLYIQDIKTVTQKWKARNQFLPKGDFYNGATVPLFEPAYFKRVGEPVPVDNNFFQKIHNTEPVAVHLSKNVTEPLLGAEATDKLRSLSIPSGQTVATNLKRDKREARNTSFSYLTASEASRHGLNKKIVDYWPDSVGLGCSDGHIRNSISRTAGYRKAHHISEVTITADDGKLLKYGIPVYNSYQEEVSFSVAQNHAVRNKGIIPYTSSDNSTSNTQGRENYYSKEITPAYATSFLLTEILSPDYVDLKSDGITDDDLGTAVKFNYTKLDGVYKWRTPYALGADSANYYEGLLSDPRDDRASYVYGEKEIWYLHSIESKTMIAHFITEDRDDALGVTGTSGVKNTAFKLRRLKEIRLYSKSDLRLNGGNPALTVPVKVVHFEYDYSVCRELPNSVNGAGKLTLRKVYFTFGKNLKGRLNPYRFDYDTSYYNNYNYRQYDRWGNLKDATYNPGGLNNSEYPYTIQDSVMAARFASAGQLTQIKLPSGGKIDVTYESDDYAYVQDKRAAIMCQVAGINSFGSSSGLVNTDKIYVDLPEPVDNDQELKYRYFQDMSTLYFKFFLDLDNKGHKEFVPGYAKIKSVTRHNDTTALITLEKMGDINPIAKAGWQFIRLNLPKYAYPGSENYEDQGGDLVKIVKALVTAFGNITELFKGYEKKAKTRGYSNIAEINKSWVRLCAPTLQKKGGGARVRKIAISDDWSSMSGTTGAETATFTQVYNYTIKDSKGNTISSGVASYEPMVGNDENLFRQPIYYSQNQFLGLNSTMYIEHPMGESFFPGASVGYSKVTVKSIGSGDSESVNRTGETVSEFFTARDYPTRVTELKLERRKPISEKIFKLIGGINLDHTGLSQGYAVETNDMHGKAKSVNIYNKSGQNISTVEYFYKSDNELAVTRRLNNSVKVIDTTGSVTDGQIGVDVELYTDMRQQTTDNLGHAIKFSGGVGLLFVIPIPFAFPGYNLNYDRRSYRSASTIKLINRFAINYKTVRTENGSTISSENLLWDAETGNVLLTKTQNEFDDPVYSMAYPAHWIYGGMGQAYQNLGTLMTNFSTNSNGTISNSSYNDLLVPGDELIDVNSAEKYWIIQSPISSTYAKRLIDEDGDIQQVTGKTVKLIRSGRRNMANMAVATIVSLNNPIKGSKLDVSSTTQILDAKASVFSEEWAVPVRIESGEIPITTCEVEEHCMEQFIRAAMVTWKGKAAIYLTSSDPTTNAQEIVENVYGSPDEECLESFISGQPASQFEFYQYAVGGSEGEYTIDSGDSAQLGSCKLFFDLVTSRFNDLANTIESVEDLFNCSIPPCDTYLSVKEDPSVSCGYIVIEEPCPLKMNSVIEGGEECDQEIDTIMKFRLSCPDTLIGCIDPVGQKINPYYRGLLGNWRTKSGLVYQVDRANMVSDAGIKGSTNIRYSGAYSVFNPFWKRTTTWEKNPTNDQKWIYANEVNYFNSKGVEVENKDALGRHSAALFGYLESLPVAVASNAMYREIGYDGFEDYGFALRCTLADTCNPGHFDFRTLLNGSYIDTTSTIAHSGRYSLKLDDSLVTMVKTVTEGLSSSFYSFNGSGNFILDDNPLSKGFSPTPGKKYVLSFWVYDGSPRDPSTQIQAIVNGTNLVSNLVKWPIVEKWKRIELPFMFPAMATSFTLQFRSTTGVVYLDDVRIHPYNSQLKSFCYDSRSQRLMAELDENNFATFYEYDDEGILIRVKKETERGIMTIKETRSSYRKQE